MHWGSFAYDTSTVFYEGEPSRHCTVTTLREMFVAGTLHPDTRIWYAGMAEWTRVSGTYVWTALHTSSMIEAEAQHDYDGSRIARAALAMRPHLMQYDDNDRINTADMKLDQLFRHYQANPPSNAHALVAAWVLPITRTQAATKRKCTFPQLI